MTRLVALSLQTLSVLLLTLACTFRPAAAEEKGKWVVVSADVTAKATKPGKKNEETAGVVVDRVSGDLYMMVNAVGIWKSTDKGATFTAVSGQEVTGRCETGFALNMDPQGKRLMCFMIYGSSAATADGGKSWTKFKQSHLDCGAVDWEGSGKAAIAIGHESGGQLHRSTDGGLSWTKLDKGFRSVGMFDEKTLLASKGDGILRSTDGGASWTKVSDKKPAGLVMYTFKGAGYWTSNEGVLISRDKGATWSLLGAPIKAFLGPYFGKDENHLVVVNKEGLQETIDGGKTWKLAAPLAPVGLSPVGPNYAWDPNANIFYASSMFKPTYKYER